MKSEFGKEHCSVEPTSEIYQEQPPCPQLRPYVDCYWASTTHTQRAPREHRVLPDGCIDFIFDLSSRADGAGKIVGTMTKPLLFRSSSPVRFVAIRFRPGGAAPFLDFACDEITDSQCQLPRRWRALSLGERLQELVSIPQQMRMLEATLLRQLGQTTPLDARVRVAVSRVAHGQPRIATLANELGLSRQHLNRLFRQHVGVGPKTFGRVMRLQTLLKEAKRCDRPNWAAIAASMGYSDQAHFVTDCRALTGLTPTQLVPSA